MDKRQGRITCQSSNEIYLSITKQNISKSYFSIKKNMVYVSVLMKIGSFFQA